MTDPLRAGLAQLIAQWRQNGKQTSWLASKQHIWQSCADQVAALLQTAPPALLQNELLDLIRLMPDAQVDELLKFVATLREARGLSRGAQTASPAQEQKGELRFLTCTQCGCHIENGLCGYDCPSDTIHANDRQPDAMEVCIYEYVRREPVPAPVPASLPAQESGT